ncbi:PREDICTED: uncharacterized protein LOC109183391 [Ipomoea nil]|uniref:uncharacterized protein LOC109183391 n=1 Tax=Ipomoea nil TaxID=35883 RepID=UPI000901CE36|nr:PREDICTED: uncharacterized protein LOC109183391 [Ipomoea nil]
MIAGDFNVVRTRDETKNYSSFSAHRSSDFSGWIQDEGLIDMGFSGPSLTWVKNGNNDNIKGARLDRAMCNLDWRIMFPEVTVTHLARLASDHAPILVQIKGKRLSRPIASFVFQAAWFTREDIRDVVDNTWDSNQNIVDNSKALAAALSEWNKNSFGNIFKRKRILNSRIGGIQRVLAENFHKGLTKLELKLRDELESTLQQEELLWYQKSRKDWIHSGDRNTAYYHAAATVCKSRASVQTLMDDQEEWLTDGKDL